MKELIAHLIGDYVLQSHWQTTEKVKKSFALLSSRFALWRSILFYRSILDGIICNRINSFLIDRFRLAKYVCYAKQFIAPKAHYLMIGQIMIVVAEYVTFAMVNKKDY